MKAKCKSKVLVLEVKETFFQEEREHQAGRIEEYVNEAEELQEKKAKIESEKEEAIEQVEIEIENKVNERLAHHNEELAIERTKLNAKDKYLRKVFKQCCDLNKELYQMKAECKSKALELEVKESFFQEEREHQAGRMKECVAEVEKLKVKIQVERTERKKATEKLQVVEEQNRKIMKKNIELKMKLQTFMEKSNDVKEIIIPTDNSSVLLVNDVVTLEPIVCKVTTASHFSSRDYYKLAEPKVTNINTKFAEPNFTKFSADKINLAEPVVPKINVDKIKLVEPAVPSIKRDNIKLAEPVLCFATTNTNELVKSANKVCSMNSLTEGCYAHEHFTTITTTDVLNSTNNNSTSVHLINNDHWVVVTINNDGWEINLEASIEVADNNFEEVNESSKQSDSQTTSLMIMTQQEQIYNLYINIL